MAKLVVYLTNAGLVALEAKGARLVGRHTFAATAAGREAFSAYAAGRRGDAVHVLTDLAEEDFRLDTIPHLGGKDRDAVLSRKLAQIFRNTPYKYALTQGREAEGRRDDRVVYTAITNGEVLRPWVELFEHLELAVAGIHSSAIFSGRLLADLGLALPHALLVTFTPGGSIRQTYFRDGEIRFSRLTPVDLEEGDTLGGLIAGETARTWQYLDSVRSFGTGDRLEVCVLLHPRDRPAVEPALRDFNQITYRALDIEQVSGQIGLKPAPATSGAEEVLAHLFLKRGAPNHYAPPELRRFSQVRSTRQAIYGAAGAVLAAGLAFAGWNTFLALQNRASDERTGAQVKALAREHDEVMRSLPSLGAGGPTMRDTVAFYAGSLRGYPSVSEFLVPLSGAIERHPRVRLTQVAWQTTEDEKTTPAFLPILSRSPPPVRTMAKGGEVAAAVRPPVEADPPFSPGRLSVALLEAIVRVDGNGLRAALDEVESLVAEIGKLPGYRATIVEAPLDISSKAGIQGRLGEKPPAESLARFTVKVTRTQEVRP
ncbi:MAG TPA: hypothetical protein PLD37_04845 [Usitatibacteraceae bacterium]|nr:hypothetical protein [Usitatibacteraceae bacterium]